MLPTNLPHNPPLIIEEKNRVAKNSRAPFVLVAYTKLGEGKKFVKALQKKKIDCYVIKVDSFSFWPRMLYVHNKHCERALKIILKAHSEQVVSVYPNFSLQNGSVSPFEIKRLIYWKNELIKEETQSKGFNNHPSIDVKEKAYTRSIVVSALKQIKYNQYGVFLALLKNEIEALSENDFKNPKKAKKDKKILLNDVEILVKIVSTLNLSSLMPDLLKVKQGIEEKVLDWNAKPERKGLLSWVGNYKLEK